MPRVTLGSVGRAAIVLLDLAVTGWLIWRLTHRRAGAPPVAGEDAADRLRRGVAELIGSGPLGHVLALELATLYYALRPPRRGSREAAGSGASGGAIPALAFTCRAARSGAITGALLMAVVAETAPLHLLLRHWSPAAAWTLTTLSAYSFLWLIGDYRAMGARVIRIIDGTLLLRCGLRLDARIPLAEIAGIEQATWRTTPARAPGYLAATGFGGAPNLVVRFREAVAVAGPFGLRRTCERIGLRLDAPAELEAALTTALARTARP